MKLVTVILLASLMQVSAASFGQLVTLKERNVTLEKMFKEIRLQSGYDVLLSTSKISSTTTFNANFSNSTIEEVMAKIIAGKDLTYTIEDKTILIKPTEKSILDKVIGYFIAVKVSGKVRDKNGGILPGVSVREKGVANAVSTNGAGEYLISVKENATLVFSYIGYKTLEVQVGSKTLVNVTLEEDAAQLREVNVVSTGYQQLDRKLFTGSSTLVKAEDSQRNGVPDISRMLEGQVAGVSVQNVSGTFGAAPKIRVRGATSISGDNKPLWVVDGIILEDVVNISNDALSTGDANTLIGSSVAGLNPDDIESFNILKDAAATAMYGARAMNGVIVVTTKKGRQTEGAPRVSYTGNFTTYLKPDYSQFDILNSADQMSINLELENKGFFQQTSTKGANVGPFGKMYAALYNYDATTNTYELKNDVLSRTKYLERYANANTDWFDVLFKNSLLQEHSLSVTSGTEKFQTYASTSYLHDSGQTIGNSVDRFTGNFRLNWKMSDKLSVELLANGSVRDQRAPGTLTRNSDPVYGTFSRDFDINPYSYALNTSRAVTPYNQDGSLEYFTRNYAPFNILNELENNYLTLGQIDFKVQGGIKYKIIPSLTYSVDGAYRFAKTDRQHYIKENSNMAMAFRAGANDPTVMGSNPFLYQNPDDFSAYPIVTLPQGGFYNVNYDNLKNYYFRQNLEFNKTIAEVHKLNVFGSMEVRYIDRQTSNFDGVGYQYDNGGIVNANYNYFKKGQEAGAPYYGMSVGADRFAAFALRAAYAYKDKYSFNATTRYDGSNLMGKSRTARWLPTWNISGAWNIDQENFWPKNDIFTSARIRATYGLVANIGNANNSAAVYYNQISRRPYDNEKETVTYISSLANDELTWEKLKEANIGADLTFLKDRLNVTVDVYRRNIYDLIGSINTSGIGGEFTKTANYGKMKAHGVEFTIAGNAINKEDFRWRTQFNFAFNKNEITSLEVNPNIFSLVDDNGGALVGHAQAGLYSIQFAGLDHNYGYPYYIDEKGVRTTYVNLQSTDIGYLKYEGPIDPTLTGGFYNQFRYKGFGLSALFTFAAGNYIRLAQTFSSTYPDLYSMSKSMLNRWIQPGDEAFTTVPALLDAYTAARLVKESDGATIDARYPYNLYNFSSERVAKGDYIRFKQISLSYDIPKKLAAKFHMSNATVSLIGNNIALLYSDKRLNGQDPEFFGNGGVALPIPKQYTLSLKVGF
ncbi:SusC/RagA family TonB-linked outer membrane protein [Pedobacter roseus]|nr:SusC/RagA family TonB-linked outer membrane protein [Pedobacter roseus]